MDQPDPTVSPSLDWAFTDADPVWGDVVFLALGMALLMWLLWLVYRTMQVPRLPVNFSADRAPNATWLGVLRYLITTPFMVMFWMLVLLGLLSFAAQSRSAPEIAITATAVVGGARLLAHMNEDLAHELAKTIPIIILGLILVGGSFTSEDQWGEVAQGLTGEYLPIVDTYVTALIVFDVVVTGIWFVLVRWRWLRRHRRELDGQPTESLFGRIGDRLRGIGYTDDEVPATQELDD